MNLSSSSPFSPHNDVLTASPTTTTEKQSLIEELKRRGRLSVTSKRYPDAKDLYTKAIDTLNSIISSSNDDDDDDNNGNNNDTSNNKSQELAILFSNRSLCYLQMNIPNESYDDALNATCHDESYVKGFWRLGQASMALKRTEEALIAYEKALVLDKDNKALMKECDKVKKQLEKEKQEAKEEAERIANGTNDNGDDDHDEKNTETKKAIKTASSFKEEKKVDTSSSSSTTTTTTKPTTGEFTKSDHVRGYKIVNGKKTSFFHHEQTEEEKRLIGDITPKRIDPSQLEQPTTGPTKIEEKGTSAWNKAGTWEEKDVTDWAIESLESKVKQCEYDLPEGSPDPNAHVQITKISKLISSKVAGGTCHASVATVRGKKRYIFEFTLCVHWEMTLGDGRTCKGEMTFLDVDGTHEVGDGYDVSDYNVDSDTPPDARYLLERFVRDQGLRRVIEKAMDDWIQLFRETY